MKRYLTVIVSLLGANACALAPRVGVGPTVATSGGFGVEGRVGVGFGPSGDRTAVLLDGSMGGGVARNGSAASMSGGAGLAGVLLADEGPNGRLGLGFVGRRHFKEGTSVGYYGFGVEAALYGSLSNDRTDTYLSTPLGALPTGTNTEGWMLGGGATLDWTWGEDDNFGTLWLPLLLEHWRFSAP